MVVKKTGLLLLIVNLFMQWGCVSKPSEKLRIATAANMRFAMTALIDTFTIKTVIKCEIVVSSSGKLTAQISQGAPYDIFVSADMKYPKELYRQGIAKDTPQVYAYGKLVLWSTSGELKPDIEILSDKSVKRIALANPKTAPYG